MKLMLARHLWGVNEAWEESFPRIQAEGYQAIETPLPAPAERQRFQDLLEKYNFKYIAMIFTSGSSVSEHLDSFQTQVIASQALKPILINSHSGRDAWSENQSHEFFSHALEIEAGLDIPLAHETHRGRILFNPWITQRLLRQFKNLRLCCDLSHWVVVCERLLDTELDIIQECAQRCIHLHTRVGYDQGPQVPDPRAPEYQRQLEAHEGWWDLIWAAQALKGQSLSTLTAEYGPPDYLHTLPYTNVPVANLWDISRWQAQRAAARFASQYK